MIGARVPALWCGVCSVLQMATRPSLRARPAMLERLQDARRPRQRHEAAFSEAVREAERDRGRYRLQEIAEAAGISRERVYRIARR
jgi:hypothetical protein